MVTIMDIPEIKFGFAEFILLSETTGSLFYNTILHAIIISIYLIYLYLNNILDDCMP